MAPPAEKLTNPTLSTTGKRGSPALPPPEQPTEDEESGEAPVRRWICGRIEKSPLSTVTGERRRPGSSSSTCLALSRNSLHVLGSAVIVALRKIIFGISKLMISFLCLSYYIYVFFY
jgi:hypothetical protein